MLRLIQGSIADVKPAAPVNRDLDATVTDQQNLRNELSHLRQDIVSIIADLEGVLGRTTSLVSKMQQGGVAVADAEELAGFYLALQRVRHSLTSA